MGGAGGLIPRPIGLWLLGAGRLGVRGPLGSLELGTDRDFWAGQARGGGI